MTITFLLGAGSSVPAGYPTTEKITTDMMSGDGFTLHSSGRFIHGQMYRPQQRRADKHIKRVGVLFNILRASFEEQLPEGSNRKANYEDILYLAHQVNDHLSGEYENPILQAYIDKIFPLLEPLFHVDLHPKDIERFRKKFAPDVMNASGLKDFFGDACHYGTDIVVAMILAHENCRPDHLCFLSDIVSSDRVDACNVVSLNHDTSLERRFSLDAISFTDGFRNDGTYTYFDSRVLDAPSRVRLIKPHGSIDWLWISDRQRIERAGPYSDAIARPEILVGTHNKLFEYTRGIFKSMFFEFGRRMRESDVLVVCGYGFGDKGINSEIVDWMVADEHRKIIVIHADPDALLRGCRGAIARNFRTWEANGRLQYLRQFLSMTTPLAADDILNLL